MPHSILHRLLLGPGCRPCPCCKIRLRLFCTVESADLSSHSDTSSARNLHWRPTLIAGITLHSAHRQTARVEIPSQFATMAVVRRGSSQGKSRSRGLFLSNAATPTAWPVPGWWRLRREVGRNCSAVAESARILNLPGLDIILRRSTTSKTADLGYEPTVLKRSVPPNSPTSRSHSDAPTQPRRATAPDR